MAIVNPNGEMQYWQNGQPFGGIQLGTNDAGEMQFWAKGTPYGWIFPTSTPPVIAVYATFLLYLVSAT